MLIILALTRFQGLSLDAAGSIETGPPVLTGSREAVLSLFFFGTSGVWAGYKHMFSRQGLSRPA